MRPESPKLLRDMADAAEFIAQACRSKSVADFRSDRLLRQAVERNFEIIGEALSRLVRNDPDSASHISDVRRIVAFRNILAHGYDVLDPAIIWDVIQTGLPVLRAEVARLLAQAPPPLS